MNEREIETIEIQHQPVSYEDSESEAKDSKMKIDHSEFYSESMKNEKSQDL
jgi:hypothetical protein